MRAPVLPAASRARTAKVYVPSGWPERSTALGLEQAAQSDTTVAPRVRRHSKLAPASPEKDQVGLRSAAGEAGVESIEGAAGAVRSRV